MKKFHRFLHCDRQRLPKLISLLVIFSLFPSITSSPKLKLSSSDIPVVINVTTLFDEFREDGVGLGCSLREAIQSANKHIAFGGCAAGGNEVLINIPAGYYFLLRTGSNEDLNNTGDLDIWHNNIALQGVHKDLTVIDGWGADRVLDVHYGSRVTISGITLTGGIAPVGGNGRNGEDGGCIRNQGALFLRESAVTSSLSGGGGNGVSHQQGGNGGAGGGIYNAGSLILTVTTVSGNMTGGGGHGGYRAGGGHGGDGGGIFNADKSKLEIYNSTISSNQTGTGSHGDPGFRSGHGGNGAGIYNQGTAIIHVSTISGNLTGIGGWDDFNDGDGGGIYNFETGTLSLYDDTIASNIAIGSGGGLYNEEDANLRFQNTLITSNRSQAEKGRDCYGEVYSLGYNLIDVATDCDITGRTDNNIIDGEANIGVLADNGGLTKTHALLDYSAAINVIPAGANGCGTSMDQIDQRGVRRPSDDRCDIGAYEVGLPDRLPGTGFPPDRLTLIPSQPVAKQYLNYSQLSLEIPKLQQKIPIVGVPASGNEWDLSWLGKNAGYLEGTSFPTLEGNSVITGHVYLPDGTVGPFINLQQLKWGDAIYIYAWGKRYRYEVRIIQTIRPEDVKILSQKDHYWVTLLTCKGYDENKKFYRWRLAVQAILVNIEPD